MFRTLLTTTALAALLTTGAVAQSTDTGTKAGDPAMMDKGSVSPSSDAATGTDGAMKKMDAADAAKATGMDGYYTATSGQILAETLIGKAVYNGSGENAEVIGDINDLVLDQDGKAEAVIIGVGGFLGIGEKDVAVRFDRVEWSGEKNNERVFVDASREQLEAAPTFDTASMTSVDETQPASQETAMNGSATEPMATGAGSLATKPADPAMTGDMAAPKQDQAMNDTQATKPAGSDNAETAMSTEKMSGDQSSDTMATGSITADQSNQGAMIDKDSMQKVEASALTSETLTGATVYNAQNEAIGEIGDIILGDGEKIEAFVVDVGGFLGIGEKQVAVSPEDIDFRKDDAGVISVFTPFTEEQLQNQAAYDAKTFQGEESLRVNKS